MLLDRKSSEQYGESKAIAAIPSDDQYRTIFERYPQPTWILDRATLRILAVNEAAIAVFGYSRDEFLGISLIDMQLPEHATEVREKLSQVSATRGSMRWPQITKDGVAITVESTWRPVPFNRVPAILLTVSPPPRRTRRLLQEAQEGRMRLEALSRRLVEIQESERAEIARAIHDEIGQLLTGFKLMLATDGSGAQPGADTSRFAPTRGEMVKVLNELIGRLRDLSVTLRPPMLDEIGLVAALHWHFERFTARTNVKVSFRQALDGTRFPAEVEIAAFRIIQEAITNVARHANADAVEVELVAEPRSLTVRIEDLGTGFGQTKATGRTAGVTGMRERVLLLGGHFSIDSALGVGTRVLVEFPLSPSEEWE